MRLREGEGKAAQERFPAIGENELSVELVEAAGEWFVKITENGKTDIAAFVDRGDAESFAEGQAYRLGVEVRRV
jgi:hypothetical protein